MGSQQGGPFLRPSPTFSPGEGGERGDPLLAWDSQELDPRGKVREHVWGWPSCRGRNIPESALLPPGLAPSALEEPDFPGNQGLSWNSSDLFVSPGSRSEPSFGREWELWAPALQSGGHFSPALSQQACGALHRRVSTRMWGGHWGGQRGSTQLRMGDWEPLLFSSIPPPFR